MFIGALDQGTTSTRFMVFDASGAEVSRRQLEHRQILPAPGWVEHDPIEIAARVDEVMAGALRSAGLAGRDLAAIGITNQRETTVVWNPRTGRPWYNAIVWQDVRTEVAVRELEPRRGLLVERTGLPPATYFSALKLRWILDHVDGVRAAVARGEAIFGTIDSWVVWNLTGGPSGGRHVTDATNASRTQLMNLRTLGWDEELAALFGIPMEMLPVIHPSSEPLAFGRTRSSGPIGAEVPIAGVLGDQHAAMMGQVCFAPGEAKNTYGTGNFMLLNTGAAIVPSSAGLLTTLAYALPGVRPSSGVRPQAGVRPQTTLQPDKSSRINVFPSTEASGTRGGSDPIGGSDPNVGSDPRATYALEGSVAVTGSAVQWLRDQLEIIRSAAEVETLAATVPDSAGIYFVPAFSGLFAPYWRTDARGVIVGLSRFHTRAHLARATLDAICFQTRAVLDAMVQDAGVRLDVLKVDGGATANNLLMQMQADILGVPVVRPVVAETTALGAAYAAGLAVGYWPDLDALRAQWKADRTWEPQWSEDQRVTAFRGWEKAVERSLGWIE